MKEVKEELMISSCECQVESRNSPAILNRDPADIAYACRGIAHLPPCISKVVVTGPPEAGKTYTMIGNVATDANGSGCKTAGLFPRVCINLLSLMRIKVRRR